MKFLKAGATATEAVEAALRILEDKEVTNAGYGSNLAIDGTVEGLPDTLANEAAFGRHYTDRSQAAFPQMQCVYLAECGTRVIVDAGCWPIHTSERVGGRRMLRSVTSQEFTLIVAENEHAPEGATGDHGVTAG